MYTEYVELQVEILNSAGAATSARTLYADIRNSLGELVKTISLNDVTEVTPGVYTYTLDIRDTSLYVGTSITVLWCTKDEGLVPAQAFVRYKILSPEPFGNNVRLLTWSPSHRKRGYYGFRIYRQLPPDGPLEEIGNSTFPFWFDDSEYPSIDAKQRVRYVIRELIWTFDQEGIVETGNPVNLNVIDTNHKYCTITGQISDLMGAHASDSLSFFVHESDAPQRIGAAYLTRRNEVTVPINERGYFGIPLIQGSYVTVELSDAGIYGKFVVPRTEASPFKNLCFTDLDTHRAQ